ncbi:hypothetical protein VNO77_34523 [Canavalia gladiata]|uniref:Uncharacterized protein n=1 Tax=Canavalia gladiata TaxID=3824 RepID=A0AAN9KGB4_CANGL
MGLIVGNTSGWNVSFPSLHPLLPMFVLWGYIHTRVSHRVKEESVGSEINSGNLPSWAFPASHDKGQEGSRTGLVQSHDQQVLRRLVYHAGEQIPYVVGSIPWGVFFPPSARVYDSALEKFTTMPLKNPQNTQCIPVMAD